MDLRTKRRLIGGAVLVLLAVIFVPMLFEDALQHETTLELLLPGDELSGKSVQPMDTVVVLPGPPQLPLPSAWAVQVGSFSHPDNAKALAERLKAAGFPAFVVPPGGADQALYRVRVGPVIDKEKAVAMGEAIKQKLDLKGYIVPHP